MSETSFHCSYRNPMRASGFIFDPAIVREQGLCGMPEFHGRT